MPNGRKAAFRLSPLRAQRWLGLLGFGVAPAAAAGLMAAGHLSGPDSGGALVFVAFLATNLALIHNHPQLRLMPLASALVRLASPVLGAGMALALFALVGQPVAPGAFLTPIVGAWLVTAFAAWVTLRFDGARPVRIAIIGSPTLAVALAGELANAGVRAYSVVGWISDDRPTAEPGGGGPRRLGPLAQVGEVVERHSVDLLAHSNRPPGEDGDAYPPRLELFEQVAADCLDLPVRLIEVGQLYEELLGRVPIGQSNAAWFQYLLHPRYRAGSAFSKRLFDLLVGSFMLMLTAPVMAVCAVAIKLADGGPVFYRQRRVGEHGREFEMIKLRSMRTDSERSGARWAEDDDERITPVGRVIRRFHVDEMPQLWNILRGEMTLVGPRPERREMIDTLELQHSWYDRRHLVKPGLAGWAQACCGYGGSEEGTGWKLCHDLYYLKHRSVYLDALVLAENVRVALKSGVEPDLQAPQPEFILNRPMG
ncbi:MAG: exopolysaccharide biosynthesis polyprenyl glycosylphosphotransferase [Solirubrobacterales bacterium]|nr:exopolysaccharide biosynthesis polyprenyl glycosylphosphotransferase [Solirubrobacterales bacterium]